MFYCSQLLSIIVFFFLYLSAPFVADFYDNPDLVLIMRILSLRIPLSVINSIQHAYVSRHMMFKRFFWSTLLGTIGSGIIAIVLAYKEAGVWALVAQIFAITIIDTIVLFITVPWYPKLLFSWDKGKRLLSFGWKILVAELSGNFFGQLRNLLVGKFFSSTELGIYNRGQQFPYLLYNNIGTAITSVLFPAMSNCGSNYLEVKNIARKSTRLIAYILFPVLLTMLLVAKPMVILLLTEQWEECIPFVQYMCIDYMIAIWGIVTLPMLRAIGRSDVILNLEIIKKPVFFILLVIGLMTNIHIVAISMILYELYGCVVNLYYVQKLTGYTMTESLMDVLPSLYLCMLALLPVYLESFLPINNLYMIIVQIASAILSYYLFSVFSKNENYEYLKCLIQKK